MLKRQKKNVTDFSRGFSGTVYGPARKGSAQDYGERVAYGAKKLGNAAKEVGRKADQSFTTLNDAAQRATDFLVGKSIGAAKLTKKNAEALISAMGTKADQIKTKSLDLGYDFMMGKGGTSLRTSMYKVMTTQKAQSTLNNIGAVVAMLSGVQTADSRRRKTKINSSYTGKDYSEYTPPSKQAGNKFMQTEFGKWSRGLDEKDAILLAKNSPALKASGKHAYSEINRNQALKDWFDTITESPTVSKSLGISKQMADADKVTDFISYDLRKGHEAVGSNVRANIASGRHFFEQRNGAEIHQLYAPSASEKELIEKMIFKM